MRKNLLRALVLITAAVFTVPCAVSGSEYAWREIFDSGTGGARSYHRDEPKDEISWVQDDAASGGGFLRAELPDRLRSGPILNATGLTGNRAATVTARVRGRGELWLNLLSRAGWSRYPGQVALTENWQEISLGTVLTERADSIGIYFITRDTPSDWVFEIDEVNVKMHDEPAVEDVSVGPWRIDLEDYSHPVTGYGSIVDDRQALSGRVVTRSRFFYTTGIPFPRTSRPVTVYLRVKPGNPEENYRLTTSNAGPRQNVSRINPEEVGRWQWLKFEPVTAGVIGNSFSVDVWAQTPASAIDCVVISTDENLSPSELDNAPALFPERPLVSVDKTTKGTVSEGAIPEDVWESASVLSGFSAVRGLAPAEEDTEVRIAYDSDNLFISFVCPESILDVASQLTHQFRKGVTEKNGPVYRDDCVFVMLRPAGSEKYYDLFVNALGTVNDATASGDDLWRARDAGWDSNVSVSASVEDGYWTVEMALPFEAMGRTTPAENEKWEIALGRSAVERREQSSWNFSGLGYHDPLSMGALVFGKSSAGVSFDMPDRFESAVNRIGASIRPSSIVRDGVYTVVCVRDENRLVRDYVFTQADYETVPVLHEIEVGDEGRVDFSADAFNAFTLEPLYLSPVLERSVRSSSADLKITTEGRWALYNNERLVHQGAAGRGMEASVPLEKGPNVLGLRLEKGAAAVEIKAPGVEMDGKGFRLAPPDVENPLDVSVRDNAWKFAPVIGDDEELGPVVGIRDSEATLRRTLLWEKTRVWPTPEPALHVARNTSQHVTFIMDGLPGRILQNWTTHVAAPLEFEMLGATGYYGYAHDHVPSYEMKHLGEREIDGRKMQVVSVSADRPIRSGLHHIQSLFDLFVRYRGEAGPPEDKEFEFAYWSEADDGSVLEGRQSFAVRVLPPVDGRQPERSIWQLWGSFFGRIDDMNMIEEVLKTARASGFNDIVTGPRDFSGLTERYGITTKSNVRFDAAWSINMGRYGSENPESRLVQQDGEFSTNMVCTSALLEDEEVWEYVEEYLENFIRTHAPDTVGYDYETGVFNGWHSCYCPRCLGNFREFAGIPAAAGLDGGIIQRDYREEWTGYMPLQSARIIRKMKDTVKKISPDTKLGVYSAYQSDDMSLTERYGLNMKLVGDLQAMDYLGCGYGRREEYVRATVEGLQGIPAVFGAIARPYRTSETFPRVPIYKARLLLRALDATGGVLVYDRHPLDGREWHAVGEITRLVAEHEDAFYGVSTSPYGNHPTDRVQLSKHGNGALLCVMNTTSSALTEVVNIPEGYGDGMEYYTGRRVGAGSTERIELEPGDVAVFVFGG